MWRRQRFKQQYIPGVAAGAEAKIRYKSGARAENKGEI